MARSRAVHSVVDADGDVQPNTTYTITEEDGSAFTSNVYAASSGGSPLLSFTTSAVGLIDVFVDEADARRAKITVSGTTVLTDFFPDPAAVVTLSKTQTLTNKTLTVPVIATISNGGTLTLPSGTDTLVGRATTDTLTNKTLTSPSITGTPVVNLTGAYLEFQEDGVAMARFWGDAGNTQGAWGFNTPFTIRNDGTPGNVYDQSNSGHMLMVQRNISTAQNATLVPISAYSQATTGDNSALTAKMFHDGGGANVNATVRAVDFESFLHSDVGTTQAVPVVGMELGIHPGHRLPFRQGAGVDDWDYTIVGGGTNESPTAKVFINMFAATNAWRTDLGLNSTEIIYRHGTGLLIHGQEGFDRHILIRNENDQDMFEHTGDGRLRHRPSAFTAVIAQAAGPVYTNRTTNASQTAVSGTNTVALPTGAGDRVYIGHRSPYHSIQVMMGAVVNSYVGTGTISIQAYISTGWANVATNMPANGSVLTDGTSAVSGGGGTGAFVQSGTITFAPPIAWVKDVPTEASDAGISEPLYWIRIAVGAVSSTSGVANVIRPGTLHSFEVYAGNLDTASAFAVDGDATVKVSQGLTVGTNMVVSGISVFGGSLFLPNGSAAAPAALFTNSATTGLYRQAANSIGFSINGAEGARLDASGNFGVGGAASSGSRIQATGGFIEAGGGFRCAAAQIIMSGAIISPAQIVANTDNYNPTGLSTARVMRLTTDASRNLTGIVAQTAGTQLSIVNVGAQDLVLVHEATSTTTNRFQLAGSANLTLTPSKAITVFYDGTSQRWRQLTA